MYNPEQLTKLEKYFSKDEFEKYYNHCKEKGMLEIQIADELETDCNTLRVLKEIHGVKTIVIRKNRSGITEEHFRKGALIGLERRIILRRVRDGVPIEVAISAPRMKAKVTHRRKRK